MSRVAVIDRRELVFQAMLDHPLPWRHESDWTESVESATGRVYSGSRAGCFRIIELALEIELDLKTGRKRIAEARGVPSPSDSRTNNE